MALTGRFLADFSQFQTAVKTAEVTLRSFQSESNKVGSALSKMTDSFSGRKVIQDAMLMTEAVDRIGGISKFTASEIQRLSAQAKEAAEKLTRMGEGVPAKMQAIANAAKPVQSEISSLIGMAGKLAGAFGVGFSVGAVVNFGKSLLKTASDIADLSAATGVSKKALQELAYVGAGAGVSMDEIGTAVGSLSKRLAGGDQSATDAVNRLGLSVQQLLAAGPTEAFIQLGDAAGRLTNPMERNAVMADLLGAKLSQNLIPMFGHLREEMEKVPKDAIISDAQIDAADKLGDAFERAMIRVKASVFGMVDAFNHLDDIPTFAELESAVVRLPEAYAAMGPVFDVNEVHLANEAAATQKAMQAAYDYVASLGRVTGATQGSSEVEKIHAAMLAETTRKAEAAATAFDKLNESIRADETQRSFEAWVRETAALNDAAKASDTLAAKMQLIYQNTQRAGLGAVGFKNDLSSIGEVVWPPGSSANVLIEGPEPQVVDRTNAVSDAVGDLAEAFAQLAQIGGDSFTGIERDIGKVIGALNLAKKAMIAMTEATSDTSRLSAMLGYYAAVRAGVDALNTAFGLQDTRAIVQGYADRTRATIDFITAQGGVDEILKKSSLTARQFDDIIRAALTAKTPEAFAEAFVKLNDAIRLGNELIEQRKQLEEATLALGHQQIANMNAVIASIDEQVVAWRKIRDQLAALDKDNKSNTKEYRDLLEKQKHAITATAGELKNLGIIAVASFGAAIRSGMRFVDALAAAAPSLQTLHDAFKALGLPIDNVLLKMLTLQAAILKNNPALMQAIGALGDSFSALSALGMLNVDTFRAMEETGMAMYAKLQAEAAAVGGGTRDALLPMQDYLHRAEAAAAELGIPLDANTQMLIDQSKQLGIWQDVGKSATDKMIDAMEKLVKSINDLTDELNNIPNITRTVTIRTVYDGVPADPNDQNNRDRERGLRQALGPSMLSPAVGRFGLSRADGSGLMGASTLAALRDELRASNAKADRLLSYMTTQFKRDVARAVVDAKATA